MLNAVSLSLSDGDTIGLVGESGSGTHPYTELLLSSIPLPDPDALRVRLALQSEIKAETADDGRGCPFKGRCHRKLGAICDTEFPPLRTLGPGHVALCHIPVADLPATRAGETASPSSLKV